MKRLVVIAMLAGGGRAHAQPEAKDAKAQAAALYSEGSKLYAAARYLDAAEKFRTAYETDPDPVYLFNVAQAYRFGDDCIKSADFYKRFLDKVPEPPNAEKVRTWRDEQDACAKKALAAKPPIDNTTAKPSDPAHPPLEEHGNGRLYAGIGTAVVGAAAIVFGVLQVSKLGSIETERMAATNVCMVGNACTAMHYGDLIRPFDDDAHSRQRNGIIAFGVGGLALGAAVYLILSNGGSSEHAAPVGVATTSNGAMVYGSWRF